MDTIRSDTLAGDIEGQITIDNPGIGAQLIPGKVSQALRIDRAAYVMYSGTENMCVHKPGLCGQGITFAMWLFLFKGMIWEYIKYVLFAASYKKKL